MSKPRAQAAAAAAAVDVAEAAATQPEGISAREAMRRFHISHNTLQRYARVDKLCRRMTSDGWLYDAEILASIHEAHELEGDDTSSMVEAAKAAIGSLTAALKTTNDHQEKSFGPYQEATHRSLEVLAAANARLLEENGRLLASHTDMVIAREKLLTEGHERELAAKIAGAKVATQTEVAGFLKKALPRLGSQVFGAGSPAAGGGGATAPDAQSPATSPAAAEATFEQLARVPETRAKLMATLELLNGLETVQLQALLGSGFLTEPQETLIQKIVGAVPANGAHSNGSGAAAGDIAGGEVSTGDTTQTGVNAK